MTMADSYFGDFGMENVLSDIKVLCDKSARDISTKAYFNIDYYRTELNRIIAELKREMPALVADIAGVEDVHPSVKSGTKTSFTGHEVAKLYEIHAVAEKLYARLVKLRSKEQAEIDVLTTLERIAKRFHQVARQLRDRHDRRPTIDINDEYDVQDLWHALLKIDIL